MAFTFVFVALLMALAPGVQCGGGDVPEPPLDPCEEDPASCLENAEYVGSNACLACHANFNEHHSLSGHNHALKLIEGTAPDYPDQADRAGVPEPPAGFEWFDIDFVIGGYLKGANFVDDEGFLLTDGTAGTESQYNLANPLAQLPAEFVEYLPDQATPHGYDYDCFRCHTTGPESVDTNGGRRQGNRPGIGGTWVQEGVQCEACHGPGSLHLPNPSAGNIQVFTSSTFCAKCHADPEGSLRIAAADEFILGNQQYAEVQASPHRDFACSLCHDPHASVHYEEDVAIRNDCQACHTDMNMAVHEGVVFEWGDYTETLTCRSCHMPPAARNASSASIPLERGGVARIGDTRSHIMYIETLTTDPLSMFTEDGTEVRRDAEGKAAVNSCYACQRCHHGLGNAFAFPESEGCGFGRDIHSFGP
jgi:hypothetical protein